MDEPPNIRQKLLQDVVSERRPDTFFSLHKVGATLVDSPIYISEIKETSMNPDFKYFDLSEGYKSFSRDDSVIVRIWARTETSPVSTLLVETEVYLPSLIRIGKTVWYILLRRDVAEMLQLDSFYHPFGNNSIIFHMIDGTYASFSDLPDVESVLNSVHAQPPTPRSATLPPRDTSSFDALMKLKDLAECIEDAEKTRAQITQQIESIIGKRKKATDEIAAAAQKQASLKSVEDALAKTRREVQKLQEERSTRQTNLKDRRTAVNNQESTQRGGEAELRAAMVQLDDKRNRQSQIKSKVSGQVRRVAQDILDVFPIEPIDKHPLCFTIRSLFLPNARSFETDHTSSSAPPRSSDETTAAALSYVVQILSMLETDLAIPLPYMPLAYGSASTIFDPLSSASELGLSSHSSSPAYLLAGPFSKSPDNISDGTGISQYAPTPSTHPFRLFPLYQISTPPKRFRWAIYLLNRDIEELMAQSGCGRALDPRNTLANLKYLLTVLASGKGEMPGRKKGVVRALDGRMGER